MFTDARSRTVVLVAHCLLNQNAISDGTADFPGADVGLVELLLQSGVGILQLPCPELHCLGLDRGDPLGGERPILEENTRIRAALEHPAPGKVLAALVAQVVFQVEEYRRHGFTIVGLIGINRSPSCGVDTTSRLDQEVPGRGAFIEALREELVARDLPVELVGVKTSQPSQARQRVEALLRGKPGRD
jgi:predicted secreted protein